MGFLSSLLPTIEGAAVMAGGAAMGVPIDPGTAALIVGGVNGAASGSMMKGLSAGMGAYGGAGLTQGLMGAGAGAIGQQAAEEALAQSWQNPEATGITRLTDQQVQDQIANKMASATPWDQIKAGFGSGNVGTTMEGIGGPSLTKAGLAAAAPVIADQMVQTKTQAPAVTTDKDMGQRYSYSPGRPMDSQGRTVTPAPDVPGYGDQGRNFGREQTYFQPRYTPINNEAAKALYGYADGGPVEQMSNANAIGANTGYPQADITGHAYATPWQTPVSQNVVTGAADTGVNRMTGEESHFADGGITGDGNLDLHIPLNLGGGQGGGFGGGSANGYQAMGSSGGQGQQNSLGVTQQAQPYGGQFGQGFGGNQTDPFAGDTNWQNYQTQMQGMVDEFKGSDQYKNFMSLQDTMRNYQQQRLQSMYGQPQANAVSDQQPTAMARGGIADAASHLGGYSDGGYTYDPETQRFSGGAPTEQAQPQNLGFIANLVNQVNGLGATPQAKGYTFDPKTQRFAGAGTDATYYGNGQYGPTGAEQAAILAAAQSAQPDTSGAANGGLMAAYAAGGMSHLGGYSDGGRLLEESGDGVSDSIPAVIGHKQPARLADGEFVVPARIVSELGNGSTEAGARRLYAMMDRVQKARKKTTGKDKVAANTKADKYLPA